MLNDEKYSRVLTDVDNGIFLENFTISHTDVGDPGNWLITKRRLHGGLSEGVDEIIEMVEFMRKNHKELFA